MEDNTILVKGSAIQSFSNICISLKYIAESKLMEILETVTDANSWYSFNILLKLFLIIEDSYSNPDAILELLGQETMRLWYRQGEGKNVISSAIDFLKYQTGSQGYLSMIKGPPEKIGGFWLKELDEKNGRAVIHDNTPFHPAFTRGILRGGMKAGGDLMWIDVESPEENIFILTFKLVN